MLNGSHKFPLREITQIIAVELQKAMTQPKKFSTWIMSEVILDAIKEKGLVDEALIGMINMKIISILQNGYGVDIKFDVQPTGMRKRGSDTSSFT